MSEALALKLKNARAKVGASQVDMAKILSVPLKTLQKWEQNKRTPRGLALEALNAKLDALLK